jgi:hypothetical protein
LTTVAAVGTILLAPVVEMNASSTAPNPGKTNATEQTAKAGNTAAGKFKLARGWGKSTTSALRLKSGKIDAVGQTKAAANAGTRANLKGTGKGNAGVSVISEGASKTVDTSKILDSASVAKKGGETVAGHALQKHAGRNPEIWGKISGNSTKINNTAMQHIDDIINGPGTFKTVQSNGISFLEKMLPDGRGIRLNMNGTFKGFIDQIR